VPVLPPTPMSTRCRIWRTSSPSSTPWLRSSPRPPSPPPSGPGSPRPRRSLWMRMGTTPPTSGSQSPHRRATAASSGSSPAEEGGGGHSSIVSVRRPWLPGRHQNNNRTTSGRVKGIAGIAGDTCASGARLLLLSLPRLCLLHGRCAGVGQPRHPLYQELGAHGEGVTFDLVHVNTLRLKHADAGCQILCRLSVLGHLDEQHPDSTVSLHTRVKLDAGIQGGQMRHGGQRGVQVAVIITAGRWVPAEDGIHPRM
jgi:hypothetical protein